jgi:hypothetical protein
MGAADDDDTSFGFAPLLFTCFLNGSSFFFICDPCHYNSIYFYIPCTIYAICPFPPLLSAAFSMTET